MGNWYIKQLICSVDSQYREVFCLIWNISYLLVKFLLSLLENTPGILEVETRVGAKHPIMYRKVYPRMTWSKMSIAQSILRKLPDGLGRTLLVVWPRIAILVLCVSFLHWKRRIAVSLEWCWYKLEGIFLSFLAESRMGVQQSKTTANN